jgi:hypothetical protein
MLKSLPTRFNANNLVVDMWQEGALMMVSVKPARFQP